MTSISVIWGVVVLYSSRWLEAMQQQDFREGMRFSLQFLDGERRRTATDKAFQFGVDRALCGLMKVIIKVA